jgi:enterochelin esterase family protein
VESLKLRSGILLFVSFAALGADKPGIAELRRLVQAGAPEARSAIGAAFGEDNLKKGTAVLNEGGDFAFAVALEKEPRLIINDGEPQAMRRWEDLWVAHVQVATSRTHNFHYLVDGEIFGGRTDVPAYGPYSYEKPGVPKGTLSEKMVHESKIYPGMKSNWWIYVPAQYDPASPAAVMVWQDGESPANREGPTRAQIVFDNLTHEKKIPVIIQVFISPGMVGERRMRSIQYDTVDDTYVRFLRDELLPEVAAKYKIRNDAYSRAIAGNSSGGICAFNAAWQMPDQFSRVLSRIGSFTSIQWRPGKIDGGNVYPFKIRKEPKRNIRVWLQDGSGDLENAHGSWPLQNIQMANSLKYRDYDFHLSWGNGTHNGNGGSAELAEEMIWLWRDYDPSRTEQAYLPDPAEKSKPMYRIKALNRE